MELRAFEALKICWEALGIQMPSGVVIGNLPFEIPLSMENTTIYAHEVYFVGRRSKGWNPAKLKKLFF